VLGDSYSAGVGGGDYEPGPCAVSRHSYAAQWVEAARRSGVNAAWPVNHACLGAVTEDFSNTQNSHVLRQLDYVNSTYDIVFLTVGGNDLDFAKVAAECLVYPASENGKCKSAFDPSRERIGQNLEATLSDLLRRIGVQLHSGARIVYLGYPSLVRPVTDAHGAVCLQSRHVNPPSVPGQVGTECLLDTRALLGAEQPPANGTRETLGRARCGVREHLFPGCNQTREEILWKRCS
jgi:hypothetical protein